MSSRITHHVDFPDYKPDELMPISRLMLEQPVLFQLQCGKSIFGVYSPSDYTANSAHVRSIRNALECARQASESVDGSE